MTDGKIKKECHLTLNDVVNEYYDVDCKKYKESTMKTVLSNIFDYAIKQGYLEKNIIKQISLNSNDDRTKLEKTTVSFDDYMVIQGALRLDNTFNHDSFAVVHSIAYYTGMRISEILGLEKKDINFEKNTISISRQWNTDIKKVDTPKTKKSHNVIPLNKKLKDILIEWFKINPYEIVCCNENGKHLSRHAIDGNLKAICSKKGLKKYSMHCYRHGLATRLINQGTNFKIVSEILRHESINTTLDTYTHVSFDDEIDAINQVIN